MKILLWTSSPLPALRGDSIYQWDLLCQLAERGHEVHVVANLTGDRTAYQNVPACFHQLRHLRGHWQIRQMIRKHQLDLVHGFVHCFSDGGLIAARWAGVPFITEIADDPISVYFGSREECRRYWGTAMERGAERWLRLLLRNADGVIMLSDHLARYYASVYGRTALTAVLPQAVDLERFRPSDGSRMRAELGAGGNDIVVHFAGSLAYLHGVQVFVQCLPKVLSECPNLRVMLVVGGAERDRKRLEHMLCSLSLPPGSVHILREVPHERMPEVHSAADICVAPHVNDSSRPLGSSPKKLTEYFACGKAVICSDLPELREMADECAVFVKAGDSEQLADAVVQLSQDPARRQQLGEAARRRAIACFDRAARIEQVLAFYDSVSSAYRPSPLAPMAAWSAIQLVRAIRRR